MDSLLHSNLLSIFGKKRENCDKRKQNFVNEVKFIHYERLHDNRCELKLNLSLLMFIHFTSSITSNRIEKTQTQTNTRRIPDYA